MEGIQIELKDFILNLPTLHDNLNMKYVGVDIKDGFVKIKNLEKFPLITDFSIFGSRNYDYDLANLKIHFDEKTNQVYLLGNRYKKIHFNERLYEDYISDLGYFKSKKIKDHDYFFDYILERKGLPKESGDGVTVTYSYIEDNFYKLLIHKFPIKTGYVEWVWDYDVLLICSIEKLLIF